MTEDEVAVYHKSVDFRDYIRARKLADYNRHRRPPLRLYAYFAEVNERRVRELDEQYPDFAAEFEKRENNY